MTAGPAFEAVVSRKTTTEGHDAAIPRGHGPGMTRTPPTEMNSEHERILRSYARLAGAERRPVASYLIECAATLVLTPIGPGLFLLAFLAATAWNTAGGGIARPALWALGATVLIVALWRGRTARGRSAPGREMRGGIAADRATGRVQEERHEVLAAKALREPEQGGIILLLHTSDGRVFACYDFDSFLDAGPDAPEAGLVPRQWMRIVRFPESGIEEVLFDGAALPTGAPIPLRVEPNDWPVDTAWWDVPWDEIEDWAAEGRRAA